MHLFASQVEDLSELFARTFLSSRLEGGLDIHHDIAPQLAEEVYQSCRDARAQMEVRPLSCADVILPCLNSVVSGVCIVEVRWL